ncbi:MAG: zf-HC2 domain-containing protein [Ignavibacteria bacterium]|jgi:hypothetical protein|nr:zf-HC2 domain-containing protein [Ignavibacteria bacterium]MDH7526619.1 zf-HC2 domain-containing protein [Ignavibacteria bacterium]
MFCDDYKKLMIEYFDMGLKDQDKIRLDEHLEICSSCKTEFNELEKLFNSLERENQIVSVESEKYIQSIDVDEIISRKKKRKWLEFQFSQSIAFALILLVSIVIYFNLTKVNNLNNKSLNSELTMSETTTNDFLGDYINQDYLYENVDETILSQSDYFKDVLNFIDELESLAFTNQDLLIGTETEINKIDENDVDEIIAQLENKKFLGE